MTATDEPIVVRGFCCPVHTGERLRVYRVRKPCAGKVRYRKCPACGYRLATVEKPSHDLPAIPSRSPT
jgi:transcriptional regulator NrdR family protein